LSWSTSRADSAEGLLQRGYCRGATAEVTERKKNTEREKQRKRKTERGERQRDYCRGATADPNADSPLYVQ
jgi:hypothetical protein